jgi:hypothetical protein
MSARVGNGSVCKMGSCRLFSSVASSVAYRARQRVPVNQSIAYPLASTVVSRNTLRLTCIGITRDFTRAHSPAQCCEVSWINAGASKFREAWTPMRSSRVRDQRWAYGDKCGGRDPYRHLDS